LFRRATFLRRRRRKEEEVGLAEVDTTLLVQYRGLFMAKAVNEEYSFFLA